jgi:hypothetical protein
MPGQAIFKKQTPGPEKAIGMPVRELPQPGYGSPPNRPAKTSGAGETPLPEAYF